MIDPGLKISFRADCVENATHTATTLEEKLAMMSSSGEGRTEPSDPQTMIDSGKGLYKVEEEEEGGEKRLLVWKEGNKSNPVLRMTWQPDFDATLFAR
jgi:hypothetical protein